MPSKPNASGDGFIVTNQQTARTYVNENGVSDSGN